MLCFWGQGVFGLKNTHELNNELRQPIQQSYLQGEILLQELAQRLLGFCIGQRSEAGDGGVFVTIAL